jgi:mannitol operon repressor
MVVGPLLHDSGPLGELSVRLKLLFGLGVIPHDIYQYIDAIIKLKKLLSNDGSEYDFTDQLIVEKIKNLNLAKSMGMVSFDTIFAADDVDLVFYQMQQTRQQQVINHL